MENRFKHTRTGNIISNLLIATGLLVVLKVATGNIQFQWTKLQLKKNYCLLPVSGENFRYIEIGAFPGLGWFVFLSNRMGPQPQRNNNQKLPTSGRKPALS